MEREKNQRLTTNIHLEWTRHFNCKICNKKNGEFLPTTIEAEKMLIFHSFYLYERTIEQPPKHLEYIHDHNDNKRRCT